MRTLIDMREREETASRRESLRRWLAVSEPLAIDDDPDWDDTRSEWWSHELRPEGARG